MPEGPFVQIATFCRSVTRSEGGNLSIHDCVAMVQGEGLPGPPPPGAVPAISIAEIPLAISMWSGDLAGTYRLTIRPEPPVGEMPETHADVVFDGDAHGADLMTNFVQPLTQPGLYWFSVVISGGPDKEPERLVARIPLLLQFQPVSNQ
jgi:hypothetical protein